MNLDVKTLADNVDACFERALDDRIGDMERRQYLLEGKRLRGELLNLVSARFNDGTKAVADANQRLLLVNAKLKSDADAIGSAVTTLQQVADLVGALDDVLKVAVSFL
jgi:hypothetical protein